MFVVEENETRRKHCDLEGTKERTLYGDGRIRSPNKTCPRFSTGDRSPSTAQKSKLNINHEYPSIK